MKARYIAYSIFCLFLFLAACSQSFGKDAVVRFGSDVDARSCRLIEERAQFNVEDKIITAFVELENMPGGKRLKFLWTDPGGAAYGESSTDIPALPKGMTWPVYRAWCNIIIRTNKAAWLPGTWKTQVFLDGEPVAESQFSIEKKGDVKGGAPPFRTISQVFTESGMLFRVVDAASEKPLSDAVIVSGGKKLPARGDGYCFLSGVAPGHISLRAEAPGYHSCVFEPEVAKGAFSSMELPMEKAAASSDVLTVRVFHEEAVCTGAYHFYDIMGRHLALALLTNNTDIARKAFLSMKIDGFTAEFQKTVTLPPGESCLISANPPLLPGKIRELREVAKASLNTSAGYMKDESLIPVLKRTDNLTMLARDTLVYIEKNPFTGRPDFLWYTLPGWVTPHMQGIDGLLRIAVDYHPGHKLIGYQAPDLSAPIDTLGSVPREQAKAIYRVLQENLKLSYTNPSIKYGTDENTTLAQRSRLPMDIVKDRSANCLESTVIFATLLEAAHLNPVIVVLSAGHAFVGWEKWDNSGEYDFLKTTDIGKGLTFEEALQHGNADYRDAAELFKKGKAIFINIPTLRRQGIIPMD